MKKTVVLVGSLDTKGEEFAFVKDRIEKQGLNTLVVDFGVLGEPAFEPDIGQDQAAQAGGGDLALLRQGEHKDEAMQTMATGVAAIVRRLYDEGKLDGVLGMGGSGNTSIATAVSRPSPRALIRAASSTMPPRDMTTTMAPALMREISFAPIIPTVSGV